MEDVKNSMSSPKVSVMIVTYNQRELISETVESVLAQDYNNLEIVIADDASTDGTDDIIKEYCDRYPTKIKAVLNKKNLGITGNSNAAFFACAGEFIAVMGGDDIFLPGKISVQVELFKDPQVVLAYHPVDVFLNSTGETLYVSDQGKNAGITSAYELISNGGISGASSVMVRSSACPAHGFDPAFPTVSDWIFFIEVAMKGKVKKLDGVYARYRKLSSGASGRTYELLGESLKTLEVIQQRYPDDQMLKRACREGAFRYVAGEAFRQISNGNIEKLEYLKPFLLNNSVGAKRMSVLAGYMLLKNQIVLELLKAILPKIKYFLKRRL